VNDVVIESYVVCDCVRREFKKLLDAYVDAVNRNSIRPSAGRHVRDNLLNNDRRFMTVFVPTNAALRRDSQYEKDRYIALRNGVDPLLLQKVTITLLTSQNI